MTDNQESFIIESSQNMKKNDKESFIGTGQKLKDEESSITIDITDALEMDVEMDMDMKKKEDESFGTEKNLKDEESSIRTDITDALEIDMEMETDNDPDDVKCIWIRPMLCVFCPLFCVFLLLFIYLFSIVCQKM